MSLGPNLNPHQSNKPKNNNNKGLFPARVKEILLSNTDRLFKKSNGWADIGMISFKPLYTVLDQNNKSDLFAKPLFSNIKNYPIKEELVLILNAPSIKLNTNPNALEYYYIPFPISLWNNMNNNSFPDISVYDIKKEIDLGENFDDLIIRSLLPEEGDVLLEGRFGNSIRFSQTTPNKKINNNFWSSNGQKGDPIIIISNNHNKNESLPWNPIQEDINKDGSVIIMSSKQEIPIDYACKNLQTFNITLSSTFNPSLQIPDSNTF